MLGDPGICMWQPLTWPRAPQEAYRQYWCKHTGAESRWRQPWGAPQWKQVNFILWVRLPNYTVPSVRILWPTAFRSALFKCSSLFSSALFVIKGAFDAGVQRGLECPLKPVWSVADDFCGITEDKVNLRANTVLWATKWSRFLAHEKSPASAILGETSIISSKELPDFFEMWNVVNRWTSVLRCMTVANTSNPAQLKCWN